MKLGDQLPVPPHGPLGNRGADASLRLDIDQFHVAQQRGVGIGRIGNLNQTRLVTVESQDIEPAPKTVVIDVADNDHGTRPLLTADKGLRGAK